MVYVTTCVLAAYLHTGYLKTKIKILSFKVVWLYITNYITRHIRFTHTFHEKLTIRGVK